MSRQICKTVYTFDELSPAAKEKARDWFREGALEHEWWDATYSDAREVASRMGIDIENIYFSGFASQGDGACFSGRYAYCKGGVALVKEYAPQDAELHRIAERLAAIQRQNLYQLTATVAHSGRYCHEFSVNIEVERNGESATAETDDEVADCLRDLMRWIYRQLEAEHDYRLSDECVDEDIRANEYEFYEDGRRAI